ncbi:hypothetical protein FQA39_LY05058 [Lamprigera yunnana]|nr:hypothetical protein FQA39_LY05058 [Lamprigera yunnana]
MKESLSESEFAVFDRVLFSITMSAEMAFNLYQWIKSQNEDHCTKEIKEKVSRATGLSLRTIIEIIKEGSTSPEAKTDKRFKSPEKENEIAYVP